MDSSKNNLKRYFTIVKYLFAFLLFFVLYSFLRTMIETKSYELTFCVSNECLENAKKIYGTIIDLIFGLVGLIGTFATVGGIIVAVYTYINNVNTNALSTHIAHLEIFQNYLVIELKKHDRLSVSAVDIYGWYNSIFTESIKGKFVVSESYKDSIKQIDDNIVKSNTECQTAKDGSFRYKIHQSRMTGTLNDFGIDMGLHPRNDYFEIETQVFNLMSSVNSAFCPHSNVTSFTNREYV